MVEGDYTMTIAQVSARLGKSIRTIHRYKSLGRLSCRMGASQGSPLFFSAGEVERLAVELMPVAVSPPADPQFWDRLERVETLLRHLEHHPVLEQILTVMHRTSGVTLGPEAMEKMASLPALLPPEPGQLDPRELGALLVRLGTALIEGSARPDSAGEAPATGSPPGSRVS